MTKLASLEGREIYFSFLFIIRAHHPNGHEWPSKFLMIILGSRLGLRVSIFPLICVGTQILTEDIVTYVLVCPCVFHISGCLLSCSAVFCQHAWFNSFFD